MSIKPSAPDSKRPSPDANGALPLADDITEPEAAELLCVSLAYVRRLLDEGQIPSHLVGSIRQVRRIDLLKYKAQSDERSRKAMEELAAQAQELNMGY